MTGATGEREERVVGSGIPLSHDGLMSHLVDSITDYAIFALDPEGIVSSWNPGAERLKGYRAEEIIGRHFSIFYTDEDLRSGKPEMELAVAMADGRFEDEGFRVRSDGSLFWANVVISAIRGSDGRLLGFGKVTRDLSERKRGEDELAASEERFRLLVSGVEDYAIFWLNPDGTVASWNRGAERLKGYLPHEILGRPLSTFYTEEDRRSGAADRGLREAATSGRWESEGWRVRKDGTRFWANAVITALRGDDGELRGFAKVTRDLTDRKRGEDALRGVLEREREATARLRALDELKTELVAVVAHDLRAPIGVLQHLVQIWRDDRAEMSPEVEADLVDRIGHRTDLLATLVDDVLDVTLIEAGALRLTVEEFDVRPVAEQIVADSLTLQPDREIALKVHDAALVVGDRQRTWQALSNLVSNALKFSDVDQPVLLTIDRVDDRIAVSVIDRGPGIPADQQHLLFRRFERLPSQFGRPGSGIGLYIARWLAERQGGSITVESEPGVGSTFALLIPCASPAA